MKILDETWQGDGAPLYCAHEDHFALYISFPLRIEAIGILTMEVWDSLKDEGFRMRAVCKDHARKASEILAKGEKLP
jgi:hypothetical protein